MNTLPVAYTKEKKLYIEQIRVIIHLVDAEKDQRFLTYLDELELTFRRGR